MAAIQVIVQYIKLFYIVFKHWFHDLIGLFSDTPLKDLNSETILITGAASGLGKGVAERLAQLGATLILWDVDEATNARVAEELNNATESKRIHAMKCDLTNRDSIYECAKKVNKVYLKNIHVYTNRLGTRKNRYCDHGYQ
jgi:all-trans-retinol dehydrogenase (NAD+)